jgi:sec-independent protein translocase protein TatC
MKIGSVSHEDRLTLVEHLDELRTRIIVSVAALVVAFGLCAWQNHIIFDLLDNPLPEGREPLTLGVTEPFLTTVTISAYAGILLALPVILYQLYAFVLPAFSPGERRVAVPLLLLMPVLFIAGVVFTYLVILDPAVNFLLNFNEDQFTIQVRARDYYSFVALTLLSMGLLFQIPMALLAAGRMGLVTAKQLRRRRRDAIVGAAVVAALLPTIDPVTMLLETVPLVILFELSIVLVAIFGRPRGAAVGEHVPQDPAPEGPR